MPILIYGWGTVNLILFFVALLKVKQDARECGFIYPWAFLTGSFVWEDLLIFSPFHFFSVLLAFLLGDINYWLLLFFIFWSVRSAGEVIYFFLQQFIHPDSHPHSIDSRFWILRKIFDNLSEQKCFIIMQVFFQIVLVASVFCIIILLRSW